MRSQLHGAFTHARMVLAALCPMLTIATGCATTSESATTITFEKAVHFATPEGADLSIPAGRYAVSSGDGQHLRLTPMNAGGIEKGWSIAAVPIMIPLESPTFQAVAVPGEDDRQHVVWVRPDGRGLEAAGSPAGVTSRAACNAKCQSQVFTSVSNVLKTRHDTAKNSIR